ncbi:unnamed protein product [Bemisia tabaci]|uniref:Helicase ATP-binding domain-containing protein n=1 Tax=Bemisia tabaci TaxID=7038 RepID=A0A9P0AIA9_BEMTA|nr:unnamed protein product [Bemisia tabaci]
MPVVSINGVDVTFPFEPYQVQLDYMKKVIECLQLRTNAVLESPTGTGKTLSLLCSSLAWLNHYNTTQAANDFTSNPRNVTEAMAVPVMNPTSAWNSKIKIIYASRTHSQLSQAMAELKRTHYADVRVTVLGSRDQLCIHPQVQKEEKTVTKNLLCRILVSGRECAFHNNVEMTKVDPSLQTVVDIEDLVKSGKRLRSCPYYLTKELQKDSDIVFAPYNYLLDPKIRKTQDISLDNAIIILDEGHNIEKVSEEVMSTKLSSTQIAYCIEEVTEVMKVKQEHGEKEMDGLGNQEENSDDLSVSELCLLKTVLLELEKVIDEFPLQPVSGKSGPPTKALSGSEIFPLLAKAEITEESCPPLIEILYKVSQFATAKSDSPFARKGQHLSAFQDFVVRVFQSKSSAASCFKLFIEPDVPKKAKAENAWAPKTSATVSSTAKVLNYWCFNPGFGLRALMDMGVRSVILTSGTLSPLDATISELGIPLECNLKTLTSFNQIKCTYQY